MSWIQALLDFIGKFWPLVIVEQWERGGYYVGGKWWKEVGPGIKVVMPWFTHVESVTIVPALVDAGRQDITLRDGSNLSFSATATLCVVDVNKALNSIDQYHEACRELIGSYLAEKLSTLPIEKFDPDKRSTTMRQLRDGLHNEAAEFGIEVTKLRFTSFVRNLRTYRLLVDQDHPALW
jgi:regulator of protease activity HflC (stomatin/prohibitin superfamily)